MLGFRQKSLAVACMLGMLFAGNVIAAGKDKSKSGQKPADPVVFSFVFLGCNRLDHDGIKATKLKSTANEAQLQQDFSDIAKLKPAPQYVFLAGDIVEGLTEGTQDLQSQLPSWIALVTKKNPLNLATTKLIAFTGNHELLKKDRTTKVETPNQPAYAFWPRVMAPNFIAGNNGPTNTAPNLDGLLNDESQLSYTFQSGAYFFMILNTDTQVDQTTIGDIPMHWITAQLQTAQKNPAISHIVVMGHKPILSPDPENPSIQDSQVASFYALLNDPAGDDSPSKVRAYLSAHAHEWKYYPSLALKNGITGKIPQVVAGNGGSPPDSNWQGNSAYFGYTLVGVTQSGVITVQSFGRKIPDPYYKQKAAPATVRATYTLYTPSAMKQ